jgi:hypothetical protein
MKLEKFNNSYFFLFFGINALTLLFNIFLSIVISCELTFELDYYLSTHHDIKNSCCILFTLYGELGNSGLPPQEKQNNKNKQTKQKKTTNNKNIKPIARLAPSLK